MPQRIWSGCWHEVSRSSDVCRESALGVEVLYLSRLKAFTRSLGRAKAALV
jgi:hypothetical protein